MAAGLRLIAVRAALVAVALLLLALAGTARAGDLLEAYGFGGFTAANLPYTTDTVDRTEEVLPGPGGSTIVAGTGRVGQDNKGFYVGRLRPSGKLDPDFGEGGVAEVRFGGDDAQLGAAAVQPDGKVVVGGTAAEPGGPSIALARLTDDGRFDPSFGEGGRVTIRLGATFHERIETISLLDDGRILVAGFAGSFSETEVFLGRFLSSGEADPSFGNGGLLATGVEGEVHDLAVDSEGGLVTAISEHQALNASVARFDSEGALDPSYGDGGISRLPIGDHDGATSVSLDRSDRAYISAKQNGNERVYVARLLGDGALDPGYADGGVATFIRGGAEQPIELEALADGRVRLHASGHLPGDFSAQFDILGLDPSGKLDADFADRGRAELGLNFPPGTIEILADESMLLSSDFFRTDDLSASRVTAEGELDPSFGNGGTVRFNGGRRSSIDGLDGVADVAVDFRERLVEVGTARGEGEERDLAIARFQADGSLDRSFSGDGLYTSALPGREEPGAVAVQSDGRILVALNHDVPQRQGIDAQIVLARFLADGSPDPTFAIDGRLKISSRGFGQRPTDVAVAPDGRIYVATNGRVLAARVEVDGSFDQSFANAGTIRRDARRFDQPQILPLSGGSSLLLQGMGGSAGRLQVVRLDQRGGVDPSFADGGTSTTKLRHGQHRPGIGLQSDGGIIVAAPYNDTSKDPGERRPPGFEVTRLDPDGSLDRGFAKRGVRRVITSAGMGAAPLEVTDSDELLVVGADPDGQRLFRLGPEGEVDRGFSGDGSAPITTPDGHRFRSVNGVAATSGGVLIGGSMIYPISESGASAGFPGLGVEAFSGVLFKADGERVTCKEARATKRALKQKKKRKARKLRRVKRKLERAGGSPKRLERKLKRRRKAKRRVGRKLRAAKAVKRDLC